MTTYYFKHEESDQYFKIGGYKASSGQCQLILEAPCHWIEYGDGTATIVGDGDPEFNEKEFLFIKLAALPLRYTRG